jgi:hypothetical protein
LLKAQDEIAPRLPLLSGQPGGVFEEQELANEIEDRRAGGGVAPFGLADCLEDVAAVLLADLGLFLIWLPKVESAQPNQRNTEVGSEAVRDEERVCATKLGDGAFTG